MTDINIKMFDILEIDFGEQFESEQGGIRPAAVCQNDTGNKYSPTLLVIPITSSIKKLNMPTHKVLCKTFINGLATDSMLVGEQTRVIDKKRILYKRGKLNTEEEKTSVLQAYLANATGKSHCSIAIG